MQQINAIWRKWGHLGAYHGIMGKLATNFGNPPLPPFDKGGLGGFNGQ